MKNLKFLLFALMAFVAVTVVSCKKDKTTNPASDGSITLKVDGTSWDASLSVQAVNTSGVINVTGSDSNAKQASIILLNVTSTGTYSVGGLGNNNQLRWTEGTGQNDTYTANSIIGTGTITVSELSATNIKGTFSFTGVNPAQASKSITDGVFEAKF